MGMCGIRWAETPAGTYDSFNMADAAVTTAQAVGCTTIATGDPTGAAGARPAAGVIIPGQSPDGISPLPIADLAKSAAFYDIQCGNAFGYDQNPLPAAMICKLKPVLITFSDGHTLQPAYSPSGWGCRWRPPWTSPERRPASPWTTPRSPASKASHHLCHIDRIE